MSVINKDFSGDQKKEQVSSLVESYSNSQTLKEINKQSQNFKNQDFQKSHSLKEFDRPKYITSWFWQVKILIQRGFHLSLINPVLSFFLFYFIFLLLILLLLFFFIYFDFIFFQIF